MRALFHWESDLRKSSHLENSSPSFDENRQVHKNKYEGYSVSLHGSKQIADSCLCPRSDYRHIGIVKIGQQADNISIALSRTRPQQASNWPVTYHPPPGQSSWTETRSSRPLYQKNSCLPHVDQESVNQSSVFGTKESREARRLGRFVVVAQATVEADSVKKSCAAKKVGRLKSLLPKSKTHMVHQRNGRAILLYLEPCSHHHARFALPQGSTKKKVVHETSNSHVPACIMPAGPTPN